MKPTDQIMKTFSSFFLILFIGATSCNKRITNGSYKGTELISVSSDNRLWPGVFQPDLNVDSLGNKWFHEVIIKIKKDSVRISKKPFFIKDGLKNYSYSLGGLYYYKGVIEYDKEDKSFTIFSSLDSCRFCPKLATATPRYSYESYELKKLKRSLLIKTNYENDLIFQRQ